MRPARMVMWDCAVPEDYKTGLVEALQKEGIVQIEVLKEDRLKKLGIERDRPLARVTDVSLLLMRLRRSTDALKQFEPKLKKSFIEDFLEIDKRPKIKTGELGYPELKKKAEDELDSVEPVVEGVGREIEAIVTERSAILERIKKVEKLKGLKISPEELAKLKFLDVSVGVVKTENLDALREKLKERYGSSFSLEEGLSEEATPVAIAIPSGSADIAETLSGTGFERVDVDFSNTPDAELESLYAERKRLDERESKTTSRLKSSYEKHYLDLVASEELLRIEKDKCEAFENFGRTRSIALMRLWAPKKIAGKVDSLINEKTRGTYLVEKDENPREAPVLLDNPRYAKPFEGLTKMFSMPRYNEVDPTRTITPTFAMFFGIMLTDAVYGAMVMGMGYYIHKKYAKMSSTAKDAAVLLTFCGLGAVIFGILTGSYLGDFVPKYMMGTDSQSIALWMDPLYETNAMVFLAFSCAVGFIQIFSGFLIGAVDNLHRGEKKAAMAKLSWYVLVAGAGIMGLSSYPAANPILPSWAFTIGVGTFIVSLAIQFITIGKFFFMNIIGVLGNTLSYARLLAMALTTSGIAISFNFLAAISINVPFIGILLAILIFIVGHLMNILLNTLGGFVGSMRLHYVEYFGAFYEGGGTEFKPFSENRVRTVR